jgi:hypothetical protein
VAVWAAALVAAGELAALRAAGLNGTPPPHAGTIQNFINTLTNNWIWLLVTGLSLIGAVLAGLLIWGSKTAPDWLFKVIAGILVILVGMPALLA